MWVVKHKSNLLVTVTGQARGDGWVVDGVGQSWTKDQAEAHAKRCEYKEHGIEFQVVEDVLVATNVLAEETDTKRPRKRGEDKLDVSS